MTKPPITVSIAMLTANKTPNQTSKISVRYSDYMLKSISVAFFSYGLTTIHSHQTQGAGQFSHLVIFDDIMA